MTGDDDIETSGPQHQQLSPFHTITIVRCRDVNDHIPRVDSPRAVEPKIHKARMTCSSTECPAPARRGRRAKNSGRKKATAETSTLNKQEIESTSHLSVDGKSSTSDETVCGQNSGMVQVSVTGSESVVEDDHLSLSTKTVHSDVTIVEHGQLSLSTKTVHSDVTIVEDGQLSLSTKTIYSDVTSDVEQKQPAHATVKGRRCNSVPAAHSRYSHRTLYMLLYITVYHILSVVVWRTGSALVSINEVTVRRAR